MRIQLTKADNETALKKVTRVTDIDNVSLQQSNKEYKKARLIKVGFKNVAYVHAVIGHRKTLWPVMNHVTGTAEQGEKWEG